MLLISHPLALNDGVYVYSNIHSTQCTNNPADCMSRHPVASTYERGRKSTEEYVNYVCETACPKVLLFTEIIQATQQDSMLQNVIKCQQTMLWHEFIQCEEM